MKLTLVLLVGLLAGCAPWLCSWSFTSSEPSKPVACGFLGVLIHSPFPHSPPRPPYRNDLLESLSTEEEENDYPVLRAGGVAWLTSPRPYHTHYRRFLALPKRLDADPLRQRPSSWLLC